MNLLVLWASFGFWQAVFFAGSFYLQASPVEGAGWLGPLCGLLGLAVAGASVVAGMRMGGPLQTVMITRSALAEAAALLGVASWYLSGDHLVQLGVAVAALCAWGLAFPRAAPAQ